LPQRPPVRRRITVMVIGAMEKSFRDAAPDYLARALHRHLQ